MGYPLFFWEHYRISFFLPFRDHKKLESFENVDSEPQVRPQETSKKLPLRSWKDFLPTLGEL